jgi:hypothetical protein
MKFLTTALLFLSSFTTVLAQVISIPDSIQPPAGHTQLITTHAKGAQIYQCMLLDNQYRWHLTGPDATLFNEQGAIVGSHSTGPQWKYRDGSVVTGRLVKKTNATHKTAAPWLLVQGLAHSGTGLFATVRFINRINTQGGVKPNIPCNSNHLGSEQAVPYQADYRFYSKQTE